MLRKKWSFDPLFKWRRLRSTVWLIILGTVFLSSIYLLRPHRYKTSNNFNEIYVSEAAQRLPLNESIFVFVMTAPTYHRTRVLAINATWLHRFKHSVIFTSKPLEDERIPFRTVYRDFDDTYTSLFYKTKFGFFYAFKGISDRFDWYVKTDDDSYLVAENLAKFLQVLNPNKPVYAGFRLKPFLKNGYNSGSIYVLSKAATSLFVDFLYNDSVNCPFDESEDIGMGRCMANAGIFPLPTRDREDRGRFHLFNAFSTYMADTYPRDFDFYYKDGHKTGFDEFSTDTISLHHMSPRDMITADLFLYRIRLN